MLSKYYVDIMKIQLREFKKLSNRHKKAMLRLMNMNQSDDMASHTTQRYWQTHNNIEQCEKEMKTIILELNELNDKFHWKNYLHQERFNFLTKDANLLQRIINLMEVYKWS